jgi:hypothetical protein
MITVHDVFYGSKLKVKRADHHIRTLKDTLNAFMQTEFYRVRIEEDVEVRGQRFIPPFHRVKVEIFQEPPSDIPLIIGDAIHNLRSALDLAVCEMIEGFGGTVTPRTHFPIRNSREEVVSAIKEGAVYGAPCDLVTFLIEIIQPYEGGNDSLYTLHTLDIRDKHRIIIPTFTISSLILMEEEGLSLPTTRATGIMIGFTRGKVQEYYSSGNLKFQSKDKPMVSVFFHDITQGSPSEDVFLTLHRLARCVSENLETLAKEYVTLRNRTLSK